MLFTFLNCFSATVIADTLAPLRSPESGLTSTSQGLSWLRCCPQHLGLAGSVCCSCMCVGALAASSCLGAAFFRRPGGQQSDVRNLARCRATVSASSCPGSSRRGWQR
jgi:hypothetical protein